MEIRSAIPRPSNVIIDGTSGNRCFRAIARYAHFLFSLFRLFSILFLFDGSTVIVRRHLSDQERKLFGHIYTDKKLLGDIRVAVGVGEDYFKNFARSAQRR